jgi:hypothetical protein
LVQSGQPDTVIPPRTGTIPAQRAPEVTEIIPDLPAAEPRRRLLPGAVLAVVVYAALRAITLVVLAAYAAADARHLTLRALLSRYDATWYATIADRGYDLSIPLNAKGGLATTNLAFFPLYPSLVAAVKFILPVHVTTAALIVAWGCGLAAAAGLYLIGAHLKDRRTGVLLAAVWAVLPHGLVESMGYSETLFTALAVFALWAVLKKYWLVAGLLTLLAGLTRPTAAALIVAVGLAALVAVIRRPSTWTAWIAGVLSPLGLLGYMAWVGHRLGRWDGYFHVQNDAWKMGFDGGPYTLRTANSLLMKDLPLSVAVTTAVVAVALLLFVIAVGERLPWPLLVYSAVSLIVVLAGDSYYTSKARLLIPAFPLLLPVVYAMTRSRNRVVPYVVLAGLTAMSALYGVYLCLVWKYSP